MEISSCAPVPLFADLFPLKYRIRVYFFFFLSISIFLKSLSIFTSFPFHFAPSENNLKRISTRLPDKKWQTLKTMQWKYKPWEFSAETTQSAIQKPTLGQREVARPPHAIKNPELGIFWMGRQTNRETRLKIFMIMFLFFIFICWKSRRTKCTKSY